MAEGEIMANGKFVSYLRVSTDRQEKSGLGIEAQRKAVEDYLNGGEWLLLAEFVETESGKRNGRPQLAAALALCKKQKATLVIARLDRLSRNAAFLLALRDGGVDFIACDTPNADRFTIGILSLVAERERDMISARTKAALAASKKALGTYGATLAAANKAAASAAADVLRDTIEGIRLEGFTTVAAIADELNRRAVPTARGGRWHVATVHRLLTRLRDGSAGREGR
jgi:DNA invertase Pin-like site-specific DNA recombinase